MHDFKYIVEAVQVMSHARDRGVVSSINLDEVCQILTKPNQFITCDSKIVRYHIGSVFDRDHMFLTNIGDGSDGPNKRSSQGLSNSVAGGVVQIWVKAVHSFLSSYSKVPGGIRPTDEC